MSPVGFEPTISAVERPQTYALDRAATGTGIIIIIIIYSIISFNMPSHQPDGRFCHSTALKRTQNTHKEQNEQNTVMQYSPVN